MLIGLLPGHLAAQNTFLYTDNDVAGPNTISAFVVGPSGALTPITGSPFPTGGTGAGGGLYAQNRVTTSVMGNFLYATNDGSGSISAFSINPTTGVITAVPSSPFAVGSPVSLAATPNGQFLIASSITTSQIFVFSIAANGSLTPVAGSPFTGPAPSKDGIKVSPNGQFLAIADTSSDRVAVFSIGPGGALTPVTGSPFAAGNAGVQGQVTSADVNCQNNLLFSGVATVSGNAIDVFNLASNGALTPISGSPFQAAAGVNSNVALLSPNDQFLFVSNQNSRTVSVFAVAANGSLTAVSGSPFALPGASGPAGLATDPAGLFLFVADAGRQVYVFGIAANGVLTPVAGTPFATMGGLQAFPESLTVYPAKTCAAAPFGLGTPGAFQVRYMANLDKGDSFIDITNTGANSTSSFPAQDGNLCVNVYAFSPDEQLVACCSCLVTPNGLVSLSARNDLLSNTLTPGVPTSLVVKLLSTAAGTTSCNASAATTSTLAPGLSAWGTTIHALPVTAGTPATTYGMTETRFLPVTLSAAELTRVSTLCSLIQTNGSGFGICKSCRFGGLGASQSGR